jgi:GT2 family glycosyltransferase
MSDIKACVDSVSSDGVEHILVVDGVNNATNRGRLHRLAKRTGARVIIRDEQGGISAATNTGAEAARGEFLVFVDQDDFLEPLWMDHFRASCAGADLIYSDSYLASPDGKPIRLDLKPDWSPVRLAFSMYACHFLAVRRSLFQQLGGMDSGFDGAQDHELALRFSRHGAVARHIPVPLYSWRESETSTAFNPESKPYAYQAGVRASQRHLDELGISGVVEHGKYPGTLVAKFPQRSEPLSVVIPTAFGSDPSGRAYVHNAILSLVPHLGFEKDDELILVAGGEDDEALLDALQEIVPFKIRIARDSQQFNFSRRCNIGFELAANEYVLLMNDDVVLDTEPAVDQMFGLAGFPNVGLVGSLLLFPNLTIQHGGHVYGKGMMHHAYYGQDRIDVPMSDLTVDREVSGVTGALALQRKETWRAVGGFCEALPLNFNDVDYCLKIASLGFDIVQANSSLAIHFESLTRKPKVKAHELDFMLSRWERLNSSIPDGLTRAPQATNS